MVSLWRKIRENWNISDSVVTAGNTVALFLFVGNCWWESVAVTYAASAGPLAAQGIRLRWGGRVLREAMVFGVLVGFLWPLGEWGVVNSLGWWGRYVAPGPRILETPVYCVLIGWLASTYCFYVGERVLDLGYGKWASGAASASSALVVGVLGENLFVASAMWVYDGSRLDWGSVPAFVPVSYGIAYGLLPVLRPLPIVPRTLTFTVVTLFVSAGLGFAVGFFPR